MDTSKERAQYLATLWAGGESLPVEDLALVAHHAAAEVASVADRLPDTTAGHQAACDLWAVVRRGEARRAAKEAVAAKRRRERPGLLARWLGRLLPVGAR